MFYGQSLDILIYCIIINKYTCNHININYKLSNIINSNV